MKFKWYICTVLFLIGMLIIASCSNKEKNAEESGTPTAAPTQPAGVTAEPSIIPTQVAATETPAAVQEGPVIRDNGIAFSKTDYFYTDSINLEILCKKPCEIYYTLDGSDPSKEKTLYSGPIRLNTYNSVRATSVRAKAYFDDGTESDVITHTYFIGKDAATRFDTLIFSVTTDPYNLYDYNYGIFVEGKLRDDYIAANPGVDVKPNDPANYNMRGMDAEREVYLEVFEPDGNKIIGQEAGIRTYGGWSRARAQKSFKIYARKEYDATNNELNYEFFPSKTSADGKGNIIDSFKQVVLRNCGNDNGFAFIRDELFETLAGQAGYKDYEAVRPAAVFVNGDYRGFFWLHDTYCDEYFTDNYGKYNGRFEIIEGGETYKSPNTDGGNTDSVNDYNNMYYKYSKMDLTNETNYQNLCKEVDVENYLDYYALEVYIGNEDWPQNNYKAYRYYAADGEAYKEAPFDGKWRYLLHDLDFSFGIYGTAANYDFLGRCLGPNGEVLDASPLFGQLMKRADCREIFIKKTLDLINGAFSTANLSSVLDSMNEERLNELKNTYNKDLIEQWVRPEDLTGRIQDVKNFGILHAQSVLNSYLQRFDLGALYQLNLQPAEGCKVKINSYVTDQTFEGNYYTAYDTTVTAILPKGQKIDYWLVNGEKVESDDLVITASMVKDNKVDVSFVTK